MKRFVVILFAMLFALSLSISACADDNKIIPHSDSYRTVKPIYKIVGESDVSVGGVKRWNTKISFAGNKKPDEKTLEIQMLHAAYTQMAKNSASAIWVFAYSQGDNYDSAFTLASCMLAPYGDWSKAGEKTTLEKYKATFKISPNYYLKK
ncbi:hypothetical protein [Synergistes jonesii]|uniref:hypothetical protein n=1 Tax=Synergistes jonesii TaxID=2754 RepID=UPI00248EEA09|nr:hypothetical protein [Synergistes jonesii]